MKDNKDNKLVYSTDTGDQRKAAAPPVVSASETANAKQTLRVVLDTKSRRGKAVTIISGIQHNPQVINDLAKSLKNLCGAGGTVEGKDILIQGDHRDKICGKLEGLGYKVKR